MGTGSKREVRPGVWELTVYAGKNKAGKPQRRYKTFHGTKRQADKALAEFYASAQSETDKQQQSDMLMSELVELYKQRVQQQIKTGVLKKSALQSQQSALYKYIVPHLGNIQLGRLDAVDVQQMVNTMSLTLSPKTIKSRVSVLSQMLDYARKDLKILYHDPLANVRLPALHKTPPEYYTEEQLSDILQKMDAADEQEFPLRYKVSVLLAIFGGLRLGEILGLQVDNLDVDTGKLTIERELIQISGQGVVEETPKTSSGIRHVILPKHLVDMIIELQELQATEAKLYGKRYVDTGALITCSPVAVNTGTPPGSPVGRKSVYRAWKRFCECNDIEYKSLHKLRHTHASILHELGISDTLMAEQMGHSNVAVTNAVYSHLFKDSRKQIADEFECRFFTKK